MRKDTRDTRHRLHLHILFLSRLLRKSEALIVVTGVLIEIVSNDQMENPSCRRMKYFLPPTMTPRFPSNPGQRPEASETMITPRPPSIAA